MVAVRGVVLLMLLLLLVMLVVVVVDAGAVTDACVRY